MAMSNSYGTRTLKFDNVMGVLLNKKARRKSSRSNETSGSALCVDRRGKPKNIDKKKNGRSKSKSGRGNSKSRGVGGVVKNGEGLQAEER